MDTPPALRGQFYSTHLTLRCPNYLQCKVCRMCKNYNRHDPLCQVCESFKPAGRHHECSVARQEQLVMLEELYGKPFFDINADGQQATVDLCTTSFDKENTILMNRIEELGRQG